MKTYLNINFPKLILATIISFFYLATSIANTIEPPIDNKKQMQANDDQVIAVLNNQVNFDVLENDLLNQKELSVGLVIEPLNGKVQLNEDNSFTYIPFQNVCEETDQFTYYISGPNGYDTASVFIDILCEPLTILTGFSPTAENQKETFTILGIENYPDNRLSIFDRWGFEIYSKKGYNNDWNGSIDGKWLATGTYYFIFADGTGKVYSGYINFEKEA